MDSSKLNELLEKEDLRTLDEIVSSKDFKDKMNSLKYTEKNLEVDEDDLKEYMNNF